MLVQSRQEIANRRARTKGRRQLGVGLTLLAITPLIPVVFAGLAASSVPALLVAMAACVGLGGWQSTTAVQRLKIANHEQKLLAGPSPAELPEARVVHTDHSH
jgi:hypothetical protein